MFTKVFVGTLVIDNGMNSSKVKKAFSMTRPKLAMLGITEAIKYFYVKVTAIICEPHESFRNKNERQNNFALDFIE